ncbi:hypothetical protein BU25DRAFT_409622 [Macroventuria anomochaeta]|uniref:Uncharacterized protein n=1 Tax=Macroventuria anomochaeta TaxID=301207 RepID=A0ACB6S5C4_9PLEO|nr:uncharacterized protein BU25DRAFT_409622 [Macroventuria anomochaeta]KAF2629158.1 hypothetical protein BU25DRAFT_409622 [Macroventuria anomochaeta]
MNYDGVPLTALFTRITRDKTLLTALTLCAAPFTAIYSVLQHKKLHICHCSSLITLAASFYTLQGSSFSSFRFPCCLRFRFALSIIR